MGVAERIGELAKERKISLKELSRRADIPYTTLYHAVKRDSKMDFETVQSVAAELGVLWYDLYQTKGTTQESPYEQRLASACEALEVEVGEAEHEEGGGWSAAKRNEWVQVHFEEIAALYSVKKSDLISHAPHFVESIEFDFHTNDVQLNKSIAQIVSVLEKMNEEGQRVAVERVEELAQIPKYQRHPAGDTAQDVPDAEPNTDPTQK